jgi:hypothetical protein
MKVDEAKIMSAKGFPIFKNSLDHVNIVFLEDRNLVGYATLSIGKATTFTAC